jgi:hypothetical protein
VVAKVWELLPLASKLPGQEKLQFMPCHISFPRLFVTVSVFYFIYHIYLSVSQMTKFKFNRRKQRKLLYERPDIQFTVSCLNLKHICSHVSVSSSLNCYLTVDILVSVPVLLVSLHSHVHDTSYLYHVQRTRRTEHIFSKCFMFIHIYIYILLLQK